MLVLAIVTVAFYFILNEKTILVEEAIKNFEHHPDESRE